MSEKDKIIGKALAKKVQLGFITIEDIKKKYGQEMADYVETLLNENEV